jgi:hypothetical protein
MMRVMTTSDLPAELDRMIAALGEPLSEADALHGWTDPLRTRWLSWFNSLRGDFQRGAAIPAGWGIARAMDHDGIVGGRLLELASDLGALVDVDCRAPFAEQLLTGVDALLSHLDGATGDVERTLRTRLREYRVSVAAATLPSDIRNSTAALSRFCTEHMDWDSEMYRSVQSLVAQAGGRSG